jgi:hypothetical protein
VNDGRSLDEIIEAGALGNGRWAARDGTVPTLKARTKTAKGKNPMSTAMAASPGQAANARRESRDNRTCRSGDQRTQSGGASDIRSA